MKKAYNVTIATPKLNNNKNATYYNEKNIQNGSEGPKLPRNSQIRATAIEVRKKS